MNIFPSLLSSRRLAIILETDAGGSAYLSDSLLASAGIDRNACFFGTISPRPGLKFDSSEVQTSLAQLKTDLCRFKPHFVLLLDRYGMALRAFRGDRLGVDDVRGYLFESDFLGDALECDCQDDDFKGSRETDWECDVCQNTYWRTVKCLATYHPSRLQMEYGLTGVARFDYQKAARELKTDTLNWPTRVIDVELSKNELLTKLTNLRTNPQLTHLDIEGGCSYGTACIGFSTDSSYAFVVPFYGVDGISIWSEEDEIELWEAVAAVLQAPLVPKCIMNALYEGFVLIWTLGIVIVNLTDDLMLSHFELYAELEKSLEFQASIYTNQPYWKLEHKRDKATGRYVPFRGGKPVTTREWFIYNGTDCCVTCECHNVIMGKLKPKQMEHYRFNVSLLMPLLYMEARGIKYDKKAAQRRLEEVQEQIYEKQDEINREASSSRPELASFYEGLQELSVVRHNGQSLETVEEQRMGGNSKFISTFATAFCRARCTESKEVEETNWQPCKWNGKKWVKAGKRVEIVPEEAGGWGNEDEPEGEFNPHRLYYKRITKTTLRNVPVEIRTFEDVERFGKDSAAIGCKAAIELVRQLGNSGATPATCGQLATLLNIHVKINATNACGDAQWYLYEHCKLPKQYQKEGNKLTTKLASNDEAVIKAYLASSKDETQRDKRALVFLKMRKLVTESKTLAADADPDGRIRGGVNLVGTDTHRITNYESPTGSGYNLTTVTKSHRDMFTADDDHWLGQRDLAGADGWTVAAYSKMLGDPTMMDDYLYKLKPAQIVALMWSRGNEINKLTREELKPLCRPITEENDWRYFPSKRIQHSSSYFGGAKTGSDQILTDTFKRDGNPVYVEPDLFRKIQDECFFVRYHGVKSFHRWMAREIAEKGILLASNGFQRKFHGKRTGERAHATVRAALAHLPQVYTTYAITLALSRLWNDPTNRKEDESFNVEPLLTVHDSLVSQWHRSVTEYAKMKLNEWFLNELKIAGTKVIIPASGSYGPNWKAQIYEL